MYVDACGQITGEEFVGTGVTNRSVGGKNETRTSLALQALISPTKLVFIVTLGCGLT